MAIVKGRKVIADLKNVFEATKERISFMFDNYDNISVSISGGKDSTVLFHLINDEAIKRDRKFICYFLDQEAEYAGTVEWMEWAMNQPNVIPYWYQVPIYMTNAVSQEQLYLFAWGDGEEWVRDKHPLAIQRIKGNYPKRFYKFNYWHESNLAKLPGTTISVIGLRAQESPDRWFAVTGGEVDAGLYWLRKNIRRTSIDLSFPLADWKHEDVWKYLIDNKKKYNKVYDLMYMHGYKLHQMRVSNLIHEKAFHSLGDLQELEPETYERLCRRLKGVHCAGIYANEPMVYSIRKLPSAFKSWKDYRVHLLSNIHPELKRIFDYQFARFYNAEVEKGGKLDDYYERYMVKRILLGDWEGNMLDNKEPMNYTKDQLAERRILRKEDEIIKRWLSI